MKSNFRFNKKNLKICAVGISVLGFGGMFFSKKKIKFFFFYNFPKKKKKKMKSK